MSELRILDVRAQVPGENHSHGKQRSEPVRGVAIHHSASANPSTGLSLETAHAIFSDHVHHRGWAHGGYHYVIRPNGLVEYALDEALPGFHAAIKDAAVAAELENGQFWNNHYLAVCMVGWFESDRQYRAFNGQVQLIPNRFTRPNPTQWTALVGLVTHLCQRYTLSVEQVRGHRELHGCQTACPGANFDLAALRADVQAALAA